MRGRPTTGSPAQAIGPHPTAATRARPSPSDGIEPPDVASGATHATATSTGGRATRSEATRVLAPGTTVGRYLVIAKIAAGGMGAVYKAFDPELDRKVAIKVVSVVNDDAEAASKAAARLAREARALAQLSHPNVVSVYDVGTVGDDVFIAMALVEGMTLRAWQRQEKRSWDQILKIYLAAGRGLAAAHEAGIVHRDFKPDNVLVGNDGRVQVVDFGIALAEEADDGAAVRELLPSTDPGGTFETEQTPISGMLRTPSSGHERLTRVGAMVGTPSYMSPEQFVAGAVDAKSDQFSFCIALYESLYGKRPFRGRTAEELRLNVLAGRLRSPSGETRAPGRLRKIVERGLSILPERRYGSMRELLAELDRDPRAAVRRAAMVVGAAGVAALAAFALAGPQQGPAPCRSAAAAADELWNQDHATAVATAFARAGRPNGVDTAARVGEILGERAAVWGAMRKQACEATWVHREQSETLLDLRMLCLDRRRGEQQALVALLSAADIDAATVGRAVEAAASLPELSACSNAEALTAAYPPPSAALVNEVGAVRRQIDELAALNLTGRYAAAAVRGESVVEAARRAGYPPVLAEALAQLAEAQLYNSDIERTPETIEQLIAAATEARDHGMIAHGATRWIIAVGYLDDRGAEALATVPLARAAVALAPDGADAEAELLGAIATVRYRAGEHGEAMALWQRALEIRQEHGKGQDSAAAVTHQNVGVAAMNGCDYPTAVRELRHALEIQRRVLGPEHAKVGHILTNLSWALLATDEPVPALHTAREAREIIARSHGPNDPWLARVTAAMGRAQADTGDVAAGLASALRAYAITEAAVGKQHSELGRAAKRVADLYAEDARHAESLPYYQRAVTAFEPAHPDLVGALVGLADAHHALGRDRDAHDQVRRAVDVATARELASLPQAQAALARSLWRTGRSEQALDLARTALAALETASRCGQRQAAELRAWLAQPD